jgi:hypothetical protein
MAEPPPDEENTRLALALLDDDEGALEEILRLYGPDITRLLHKKFTLHLGVSKLCSMRSRPSRFRKRKSSGCSSKFKGDIPLSERRQEEEEEGPVWTESELTQEEEALVALHRNSGGELPPAIQEKLRRLREKARSEPMEGKTCDDYMEPGARPVKRRG